MLHRLTEAAKNVAIPALLAKSTVNVSSDDEKIVSEAVYLELVRERFIKKPGKRPMCRNAIPAIGMRALSRATWMSAAERAEIAKAVSGERFDLRMILDMKFESLHRTIALYSTLVDTEYYGGYAWSEILIKAELIAAIASLPAGFEKLSQEERWAFTRPAMIAERAAMDADIAACSAV